ncbi:restriction endonuclease subunit S [Pseudoalteromonas sp. T1lg65]|uniref:restriction endonuclease subunit S n=1 Tax=Pseudoalteromonas sp. T1lg65 TaxID=2077101 RepID=UPI003F7AD41A
MGKYKAYPEYKDSCNDWLGDIPLSWEIAPISSLSHKITNGYVGPTRDIFFSKGVRYLQSLHIKNNSISFHTPYYVTEDWSNSKSKSILNKGDVLVVQTGDIGQVAAVTDDFVGCNCHALIIIATTEKLNGFYLSWLLNSDYGYHRLKSIQTGALHPHLNCDMVKTVKTPVPSVQEQIKIVNFLDHETAKIDTLIENQQQLIKLLKEKRQAVISHAVTKGLNPNARMKDSGVEWLGEIPEEWDVALIKYKCTEVTDGAHISPETEDGEHYFVSIRDIKEGVINFSGALLTSPKSYDYLVKTGCMPFQGDILFSKDGTIGQTAITPAKIKFVVASSLIIIRPDKSKVTSLFLDFLLQSSLVKEQVESFVKGAALRRLSIQNLLKVFGVFPPIKEQQEIANHIQAQLYKFKKLEVRANEQVELLKERRTALISAAVTGKIDVRNWQKPKAQEEDVA